MPGFELTRSIIQRAIDERVFPGAVVEVGTVGGTLWSESFGHLTYAADAPATPLDALYDLASLTKVIATTTLTMQLVDREDLRLSDRISTWIPEWAAPDREPATVRHLLAHSAGLVAWAPLYQSCAGRSEFQQAICRLPLEYGPGTAAVYSDLGFILLGFMLEDSGRAALDAQFNRMWSTIVAWASAGSPDSPGTDVSPRLRLGFQPREPGGSIVVPTEQDPWRGRLLEGEVHDENCWALGGVAGHAGLFGTAAGVGAFARCMLGARLGVDNPLIRPKLAALFTERQPEPGSTRALGWNTMAPTSSCGSRMSADAFGHTGFTGTSLWIDPRAGLYVVLLTNRVHPSRQGDAIQRVRPALHDSIMDEVRTR